MNKIYINEIFHFLFSILFFIINILKIFLYIEKKKNLTK